MAIALVLAMRVVLLLSASLLLGGCHALSTREPTPAERESAAILKACPLGVPSTHVRTADRPEGTEVTFSTSMPEVNNLRLRVRDQAKANGPKRHSGAGHDGRHGGYHDHGLQLWS